MLIQTSTLKVINNKRKKLTQREIIDRITGQIALAIILVSKESKFRFIQTYRGHVSHLIIYSNSLINAL